MLSKLHLLSSVECFKGIIHWSTSVRSTAAFLFYRENWDSEKWLSQRHTAEKWQSQCLNLGACAYRAYTLEGEV